VQHISDLHSKFALRPHNVWKYGRQLRQLRIGKEKRRRRRRNHRTKLLCPHLLRRAALISHQLSSPLICLQVVMHQSLTSAVY